VRLSQSASFWKRWQRRLARRLDDRWHPIMAAANVDLRDDRMREAERRLSQKLDAAAYRMALQQTNDEIRGAQ
jgi:hypothetical protein